MAARRPYNILTEATVVQLYRDRDEGVVRVNPTCTSCRHSSRVKSTFFPSAPRRNRHYYKLANVGRERCRRRKRRIKEVKEPMASRPGTARGTGEVESNRAVLGFRSDRAAKTNRVFCGRFVAVATIVDVRSPADRIWSIELSRSDCYVHGSREPHIRFSAFWSRNVWFLFPSIQSASSARVLLVFQLARRSRRWPVNHCYRLSAGADPTECHFVPPT